MKFFNVPRVSFGKRGQIAEGTRSLREVSGIRSQASGILRGLSAPMGKRGQIAEGIHMMYRLFMVSVVAFIIFGAGSYVYTYHIDIRDVEARILTREVVECLVDDGVLDLRGDVDGLIGDCSLVDVERAYVGAEVFRDGDLVSEFSEGDSGSLWLRGLYGKVVATGNAVAGREAIAKYEPGYYEVNYSVVVLDSDGRADGVMRLEVLVNYED